MRPRISIRQCVRPSVGPLVRNAFVKIAENGLMQDEGAFRAVYPALFDLFLILGKLGKKVTNPRRV